MSTFINTIDELGDEIVFKQIIERTITEYKDNSLINVGQYAFNNCSALTTVDLPNVKEVGQYAFDNCSALTTVDLGAVTRIDVYSFRKCTSLKSVVIRRSDGIPYMASKYSFYPSGISNGTGYYYVPRAYLSDTDSTKDYRRALNWSDFANQFRVLEDYTVDGTITGELDLTKI